MSSRKKRISRNKKMKPTFFVFCEGNTEVRYVKHLKSKYRVPFEIDTKIAKNKIKENYIKSYKKNKFTHKKDKTFLLYDIDAPKMLDKLQTIPNTILLASNPCIEFWYLLHYKNHKASVNCNYCNKELKNSNKKYDKTILDTRLKAYLNKNQDKAVERAKRLKHYNNPSSTVYILIEALEKAIKENQ
jgi:RloB-like protein